ncbi:MAG TPA: hypothetical protein VIL30_09610 [Ramlibacter sp.]|jgi:hypothetical protein
MSFFSAFQALLCVATVVVGAVATLVVHSALGDCAADAEGHA